jgi:hypothetical protein
MERHMNPNPVPSVSVISPNEVAVVLMAGFAPESVVETVNKRVAIVFSADARSALTRFREAKERALAMLELGSDEKKGSAR